MDKANSNSLHNNFFIIIAFIGVPLNACGKVNIYPITTNTYIKFLMVIRFS